MDIRESQMQPVTPRGGLHTVIYRVNSMSPKMLETYIPRDVIYVPDDLRPRLPPPRCTGACKYEGKLDVHPYRARESAGPHFEVFVRLWGSFSSSIRTHLGNFSGLISSSERACLKKAHLGVILGLSRHHAGAPEQVNMWVNSMSLISPLEPQMEAGTPMEEPGTPGEIGVHG